MESPDSYLKTVRNTDSSSHRAIGIAGSSAQLDRIDLSTNSREILAALIKLLAPHVPYSLNVLGTILNASPRASMLQDVDPSKVSLWSTISLGHPDVASVTDPSALFSIVTFSHADNQFRLFCSGESNTSDPPTEAEEAHVKQVVECLRDIASGAHSTYNAIWAAHAGKFRYCTDDDPPMIVIGAVHTKWTHVLASTSMFQSPNVRYAFTHDDRWARTRTLGGAGDGNSDTDMGMQVSEIQASDMPFVDGASSIPRPETYILSRAPYSVCLRVRLRGEARTDSIHDGRPVACVLMHSDGSIGALRVDPKHQRQGLGRLVMSALVEKLDFNKGQGARELIPEEYRDLGGGALGWNWTDVAVNNVAGHRFFGSLGDKKDRWMCHWTYMIVNPSR